ncbi:hypothetical protein GCM10027586_01940 [Kineococcus gypseus]|uniref:SAF domain-containing protein n=1 Tax=Kineococcus gypseus TaxID=1637102 RepID=UPI003D7C7866
MTVPTTRPHQGPATLNGSSPQAGDPGGGRGGKTSGRQSASPTSSSRRPQLAARPATPVRGRRRPALIGAGALLIVLPSLAAAWFFNSSRDVSSALVMAQTVEAGAVIERDDLSVAELPQDSSLRSIDPSRAETVLGQRAATDLPVGAVLNPNSTVAEVVPAKERAVVGVLLTLAQMPQDTLRVGDNVRLVDVPANDTTLSLQNPASIDGVIASVGAADANGATVVNVDVQAGQAALLASHAAISRITLVLDARER